MSRERWSDEAQSPDERAAVRLLREGDPAVALSSLPPLGRRGAPPARGRLRVGALVFAVTGLFATIASGAGVALWALRRPPELPVAPAPVAPQRALAPRATPLEREAEVLHRALTALSSHDAQGALEILSQTDSDPGPLAVDRQVVRARALMALGRFREALPVFDAVSEDRLTPGLKLLWADALERSKQCRSARRLLEPLDATGLSDEEVRAREQLLKRCPREQR